MISSRRSLGTSTGSPSPQSATPSRCSPPVTATQQAQPMTPQTRGGEEQGGRPGQDARQPSHDESDQREPCGDAVQVVLQRPRSYRKPGQKAEGGADGGDDSHKYGEAGVSAER
ncbi:hypothetical protein O4G19_08800 [Akkermansia muciniphila]|nr:hypothetical protein [Akkermansia muciniphila]WMB19209.1 hypothetical protein O4G19_08800 [Akkermansia muciniphila]